MSCEHVGPLISELLDDRLAAEQRGSVLQHLKNCRKCRERSETFGLTRAGLRAMRSVQVPGRLAAELQVAASKERVRTLERRSLRARLHSWSGCIRLSIDNMMRPLALPFAGGLLSAFVLFSSLVPSLAFQRDNRHDVPIMLFTDPALEEMGHSHLSADDTVLELVIDERGRVTDYSAAQGKLTPEMVNDLLFYRFAPATAFGVPTWGRVTVTFRRAGESSRIVVRG